MLNDFFLKKKTNKVIAFFLFVFSLLVFFFPDIFICCCCHLVDDGSFTVLLFEIVACFLFLPLWMALPEVKKIIIKKKRKRPSKPTGMLANA